MEVTLNCTKGNAKIRLHSHRNRQTVEVLTGRRRKWDVLHWALMDRDEIAIQGLYWGRYTDAEVSDAELLDGLDRIGATETILDIRQARGN